MAKSKIEWTDRVWNVVTGCTKISPGCDNCYAERMSKRLAGRAGYPADEPFRVTLHRDRLDQPQKWRGIWKNKPSDPSKIFVCSMGDIFHDDVPYEFLFKIFDVIYMSQYGKCMETIEPDVFIILTKRPENALRFITYAFARWGNKPFKNLWLGVTAENQEQADKRVPILLEIPAAVRFVSVEPMLGPVDLKLGPKEPCSHRGCYNHVTHPCEGCGRRQGKLPIDWVICGGESGPGARPMHPDWARNLQDQCQMAGVPYFFKQHGEWIGADQTLADGTRANLATGETYRWGYNKPIGPPYFGMNYNIKVGKKNAGCLLDGKEYKELPEVV